MQTHLGILPSEAEIQKYKLDRIAAADWKTQDLCKCKCELNVTWNLFSLFYKVVHK